MRSVVGVARKAAGEEVVETPVPRLHPEQVLEVGDEPVPRIVDLEGLARPVQERLKSRLESRHQQVQAGREVTVQGSDGHVGVARDRSSEAFTPRAANSR